MKGVFVVGAGPAGMFAARQLALAGYETTIFNRDIRPGGLAQYGIYPLKTKMKTGLRKQFAQVLALPNVHYYGNVQIGEGYDLTLADLGAMNPAAIVFACGAQGAKKLGLPGEDARGIYAAKDFVYHYNQLAPYAQKDFSTGRHVAIIGVGNVAIDMARWLLLDQPGRIAESVTIIARRGPLEVKFDKKEIENVEPFIDRDGLELELARVRQQCMSVGQDVSPETIVPLHFPQLAEPGFKSIPPRLSFRFLSSPKAFRTDEAGRVRQLEITENTLILRPDGSTAARATDQTAILDVDTVLFAIGDRQDPAIGLPIGTDGFATRPATDADPEHVAYELWDPKTNTVVPGRFVVGWARKASTGLAGIARHDGEAGAKKAIEFLAGTPDPDTFSQAAIRETLLSKGVRFAEKGDLDFLARAEERRGPVESPLSFHLSDVEEIFQAMDEEKMPVAANSIPTAPVD